MDKERNECSTPTLSGKPSRMNAIYTLGERIERLRHEARGLECLMFQLEHIPLTPEADEALWRLITDRR